MTLISIRGGKNSISAMLLRVQIILVENQGDNLDGKRQELLYKQRGMKHYLSCVNKIVFGKVTQASP